MLVLTRKQNEQVILRYGKTEITIEVSRISGNRASLAIKAPPEVEILRGELIKKEEIE